MKDLATPTIEQVSSQPVHCLYCYTQWHPVLRLASHIVDGTSVCSMHLSTAVRYAEHAREARQ